MATNIIIGGQIYIPGEALSLKQMQAIQLSIALDTNIFSGAAAGSLEAQAYAQYVAQGGQQFIANAIASGTLPAASSGAIVANANQARDENASTTLPSPPAQVATPTGRIQPAGSGPDGAGQVSGTNAVETPTQQNNPTVGTDGAVRPISQTQATPTTSTANNITNTNAQLDLPIPPPGSVYVNQTPTAANASPGVGAGADGGGVVVSKSASPFPQYRARTQSYVYQAVSVTSTFKQGRFEQTLHGILFNQSTANTTQADIVQRETGNVTSNVARAGSTSTQASVRAVDNALASRKGTEQYQRQLQTNPGQAQSATAIGVQQVLNPVTQSDAPTLSQLQSSAAYINARRQGISAREALEIARKAFANGTAGQ